jgi:hypothetical protein
VKLGEGTHRQGVRDVNKNYKTTFIVMWMSSQGIRGSSSRTRGENR